jgi:hypothetical protein
MSPDMVAEPDEESRPEVMASVERDATQTFIIADVSHDGAHLTVPLEDAAALPAWR